jgi:glycosyltransferase involved in cell wall biosynthesis
MFTVVIPNFNHGHLIRRAVASCFLDHCRPDRILILDDGSTDNSLEVIKDLQSGFPAHIDVLAFQKNRGVSFVLSDSLNYVETEYVVYRAADDVFLPGFFDRSLKLLQAHRSAGLAIGDVGYFRESPETLVIEKLGFPLSDEYFEPEVLTKIWPDASLLHGFSIAYRASSLREVGGFKTDLLEYSDLFATLAVAQRFGLIYLRGVLSAVFLAHSTYGNKRKNDESHISEICRVMWGHIQGRGPEFLSFTASTRWYEALGSEFERIGDLIDESQDGTGEASSRPLPQMRDLERQLTPTPREYGVSGVVLDRLTVVAPQIIELQKDGVLETIIVFGAGGHTIDLINCWVSLGLPSISLIFESEKPKNSHLSVSGLEIEICYGSDLLNRQIDLLIFSSKSFESQMRCCYHKFFTRVRFGLCFWRCSASCKRVQGGLCSLMHPSVP